MPSPIASNLVEKKGGEVPSPFVSKTENKKETMRCTFCARIDTLLVFLVLALHPTSCPRTPSSRSCIFVGCWCGDGYRLDVPCDGIPADARKC